MKIIWHLVISFSFAESILLGLLALEKMDGEYVFIIEKKINGCKEDYADRKSRLEFKSDTRWEKITVGIKAETFVFNQTCICVNRPSLGED